MFTKRKLYPIVFKFHQSAHKIKGEIAKEMVQAHYKASVIFEASIDTNGYNYLVIYGKHINGYFCCIPNWNLGCEMAEPGDVSYNAERLIGAGITDSAAKALAKEILTTIQRREAVA